MPYFAWRGIHITGKICKGRMFARSEQDLDTLLVRRDIALLGGVPARAAFFLVKKQSEEDTVLFLRQLATLLCAGILLPDALLIVAEQIEHPHMQEQVYTVAELVHKGVPLSEALAQTSSVYDPLTIQMVQVGQEAGILDQSLTMLCDHRESMAAFKKKVRASLMMPLATLIFFGAVSSIIFIVIIPKFAALFQSMHQELPAITKMMIRASDSLWSWRLYIWLTAGGLIALLIRAYGVTAMGKKVKDVLLLRVPIMGESVLQRTFFSFFHAVSMMLGAGVPLLHALGIAKQTIANTLLHDAVTYMERDVTSGSSLSQSMSQLADPLFGPDIIAMVRVGEESGSLDTMLERIAQIYQSRMYRTLTLMTTFLQPMLMIVLGLLVCVLMFAVYMPIFRLSQGVG